MGLRWIAVALATILLAAGSILTSVMGEAGTRAEERTLKLITTWAVASLDLRAVKTLAGAGGNRSYALAKIRGELRQIRRVVPDARFAYLMTERGGQVVFLADGEDETSPAYSPPGQAYPNPSMALISVLAGAEALVEEPYRDAWGEWTSGLAPVKDRATGKVLAVLGIDIPAERWRAEIDGYRVWGVVIAVLIVALMAGMLLAQWREQQGH